jgi:hypothetical protein
MEDDPKLASRNVYNGHTIYVRAAPSGTISMRPAYHGVMIRKVPPRRRT